MPLENLFDQINLISPISLFFSPSTPIFILMFVSSKTFDIFVSSDKCNKISSNLQKKWAKLLSINFSHTRLKSSKAEVKHFLKMRFEMPSEILPSLL